MFSRRAPTAAVAVAARAFKTKASQQAAAAAAAKKAEKANQGRDPYGLFKQAMMSEPDADAKRTATTHHKEWQEHRAKYSRYKIQEHFRINGHFSKMIKARNAALDALPVELQEECRQKDYTMLPIERKVYTETAPIPDFQNKLIRSANSDT